MTILLQDVDPWVVVYLVLFGTAVLLVLFIAAMDDVRYRRKRDEALGRQRATENALFPIVRALIRALLGGGS
ncbi:hypothetical protein [Phaeospirillum tilakii]|uniref:Uncharacterized protein n=1 Tax=Phaeospirillum tilakii TaxID=741673 RepID=A0ABW5C8C1_9PROT